MEFFYTSQNNNKTFLTGVSTDSHRLSSSSLEIQNNINFSSIILPRKTVFQLCSLLTEIKDGIKIQISDTKIKFQIGNIVLISKVIDGKFPDYRKVVPVDQKKHLLYHLKIL